MDGNKIGLKQRGSVGLKRHLSAVNKKFSKRNSWRKSNLSINVMLDPFDPNFVVDDFEIDSYFKTLADEIQREQEPKGRSSQSKSSNALRRVSNMNNQSNTLSEKRTGSFENIDNVEISNPKSDREKSTVNNNITINVTQFTQNNEYLIQNNKVKFEDDRTDNYGLCKCGKNFMCLIF